VWHSFRKDVEIQKALGACSRAIPEIATAPSPIAALMMMAAETVAG
jgi:hypothetical protein